MVRYVSLRPIGAKLLFLSLFRTLWDDITSLPGNVLIDQNYRDSRRPFHHRERAQVGEWGPRAWSD